MGTSYLHQEVSQIAQQYVSSYSGYYSSWYYIYPQWDYALQSFQSLGMYVSQNMGLPSDVQEELFRYVVEYRRNYTDFAVSAMRMVQQHLDWIHGNYTLLIADVGVFLVEFDAALRLADIVFDSRPECGLQDQQMFTQSAVGNLSSSMSTTMSYMMSNGGYLYGIVNQQTLQSFQSMFSMAVMDMYCPISALKQLELNYFETNRALIRKQLENLSQTLSYFMTSGMLVTLTGLRDWTLNVAENVGTWPCQYPDQYANMI